MTDPALTPAGNAPMMTATDEGVIMAGQFQAWYVAKHADGSWNFTWSTKLPVLTWDRDENGVTGFVQNPVGDGAVAAYLIPANDVEVTGAPVPTQYFLRYVPAT